jgi:ataxia telangiectasia mutated family protein
VARLEQPAQIMSEYLAPAIAELNGLAQGDVAGRVFHQYASFCDAQLHNPDLNADFDRIRRMRDTRGKEVEHFRNLAKTTKDKTLKDRYMKEYRKTSNWFKLDKEEYDRLRDARESFMTQSLENYLLALSASDAHNNDVLRFFALWLEFADSDLANASVGKHLGNVPTAKFVRLMNQLSSRLLNDQTPFQDLLSGLVLHIAIDHPFHAMHHISAGSSAISATGSESAKSRMGAAKAIAGRLKGAGDTNTSAIWHNISQTDRMYHNLAILHDHKGRDTIFKAGRDLALDDYRDGRSLTTKMKDFKLPPPTMDIPVRPDKNYRNVPRVIGFLPKMRIANGLSAPKIVVARCSDGRSFKQLVRQFSPDSRTTNNLCLVQMCRRPSPRRNNGTSIRGS